MLARVGDVVGQTGQPLQRVHGLEIPAQEGIHAIAIQHGLRRRHLRRDRDLPLRRRKQGLAERGYDPVFGARPLKRTIQRMIENQLAVELLAGRFEGDHVVVELDGETFIFRKEAPGAG